MEATLPLLDKVIDELRTLPHAEQQAFAELIQHELNWTRIYQTYEPAILKMAEEAWTEHEQGLSFPRG